MATARNAVSAKSRKDSNEVLSEHVVGDTEPKPAVKFSLAEKKLANLRYLLEKDVLAADLKWSLFVAACQHYKYDSCLKPFPPKFANGQEKNIDALRDVVDRTPSLTLLLQVLRDAEEKQVDPDKSPADPAIINLLHWVLLETQKLKRLPQKHTGDILSLVKSTGKCEPPSFIFAVCHGVAAREARWSDLTASKKTFYAFHGSRLENFYSIIQHGLQQIFNKNTMFGPGIYLTTELSMSLFYSPTGHGWGKSNLGPALSIVALCEVIDHPDVRYPRPQNRWSSSLRPAGRISLKSTNEVPDKYIVVTNSELVRVRYLLVYTRPTTQLTQRRRGVISWVRRHKLLTFIVGYVMLLVSVGLANNSTVQRHFRMLIGRS